MTTNKYFSLTLDKQITPNKTFALPFPEDQSEDNMHPYMAAVNTLSLALKVPPEYSRDGTIFKGSGDEVTIVAITSKPLELDFKDVSSRINSVQCVYFPQVSQYGIADNASSQILLDSGVVIRYNHHQRSSFIPIRKEVFSKYLPNYATQENVRKKAISSAQSTLGLPSKLEGTKVTLRTYTELKEQYGETIVNDRIKYVNAPSDTWGVPFPIGASYLSNKEFTVVSVDSYGEVILKDEFGVTEITKMFIDDVEVSNVSPIRFSINMLKLCSTPAEDISTEPTVPVDVNIESTEAVIPLT